MTVNFLQANHGQFWLNNKPLMLRGYSLACWMNLEHFMIGLPGSDSAIRAALNNVYGQQNTEQFFSSLTEALVSDADFQFLSRLGINSLRLVLNYHHFDNDLQPGASQLAGFAELERVLSLCRKYNIFAILDMHNAPGGQNPDSHSGSLSGIAEFWRDAGHQQRFIQIWQTIAERYQNEPIIAGYDLLNEPAFVPDKNNFNQFYQRLIGAIRERDNNHILFLEGDNWARDFSIFDSLHGNQLALSFHFYPSQHMSPYLPEADQLAQLDEKIQPYIQLRHETGLPLWVGETGGLFPITKRQVGFDLVERTLASFEAAQISWCLWAYKDINAMGLVYPTKNSAWLQLIKPLYSRWKRKHRRTEEVSYKVLDLLKTTFDYDWPQHENEKHHFRIGSLIYDLHVEHALMPLLKTIDFKTFLAAVDSFQFGACDISTHQLTLIKRLG